MGNVRVSTSALASLLVAALGVSLAVGRGLGERQAAVGEVGTALRIATLATRGELRLRVLRAANDPLLQQNVSWKLARSVAGALEAQLERGAIDQWTMVTDGCGAERMPVHLLPSPMTIPCPLPEGSARSDGVFFLQDAAGWALAASAPLGGGSGARLVGLVRLDPSWVEHHPDLRQALAATGVTLTLGTPQSRSGPGGGADWGAPDWDPQPSAHLRAQLGIDRALLSPLGVRWLAEGRVSWTLWGLALLIGIIGLLKERLRRARDSRQLGDFLEFATGLGSVLLPATEIGTKRARPEDSSEDLAGALARARRLIDEAMRAKGDALHRQSMRLEELRGQVRGLSDQIADKRQRLYGLAEVHSVAAQVAKVGGELLRRLDEWHGAAEDLVAVSGRELALEARTLVAQMSAWQQDIAARGARKFIRSLAETPGERPEETLLDAQLRALGERAARMSDLALGAGGVARRLRAESASLAPVVGHWYALAQKSLGATASVPLGRAIGDAQALVRLGGARVEFVNVLDEGVDQLGVPRDPLLAGLFHVYSGMAEDHGSSAVIKLVTRGRVDGERLLLVVQAVAGQSVAAAAAGRQAYHLEVCRALLEPFGMEAKGLPVVAGLLPIAISMKIRPSERQGAQGEAATAPSIADQPALVAIAAKVDPNLTGAGAGG